MKIKTLKINTFRHMDDMTLEFGDRITAIAGQNGTGKSSILGLIGHVFTYSKTEEESSLRTLSNKKFETVYSEIFRFSYPEFDKPKQHRYELTLDSGVKIPVISHDRIEKGKPKELRFRVGKSTKEGGKIPFPVIYLGLRRLFPLAQEEKVTYNLTQKLSSEEIQKYQQFHNEVLCLDEQINPKYLEVSSKEFYGVTTDCYDPMGSSAGQDNIGQIITALLSFNRLKEKLKTKYSGGILLIDELDATLYPGAQIELVKKLFRWAQDLDLQIIFTTHSLEILNILFDAKYKSHSRVIYLKNDQKVKNYQKEADIKKATADLLVKTVEKEYYPKIPVFCEDEEARLWLSSLLTKENRNKIHILKENFGGDELVHWAKKKVKFFIGSIFVLDGDMKKKIKKSNKCPRILFLPGDENPEKIFYEFLNTSDADPLFSSALGGYTRQVCYKDLRQSTNDRVKLKAWMKDQKRHLGKGYSKLFKQWEKFNKEATAKFNNNFKDIIDKIELKK